MKSAGLVLAAILLFLVVAVDFTGRLMSVLADGVLVGGEGAYFHERRSLNNFHRDRVITFEQIAE